MWSKFLLANLFVHCIIINIFSQAVNPGNPNLVDGRDISFKVSEIENGLRPVQSAVPFLNITPDPRAAALGDQGVSTTPDIYSPYWNPAKTALMENDFGVGFAFTPWLRKLVNDMYLSHLTGYYKLRKEDALHFYLTYFNLGSITFTNNTGDVVTEFTPNEWMGGVGYSRKLSRSLSAGVNLKYIFSNLAGNFTNQTTGTPARPGMAAAADIGFYYNRDFVVSERDFNIAAGATISHIGNKISYTNSSRQDFLPTILRLGTTATYLVDDFNKFSFSVMASKLMVPSSQLEFVTTPNTAGGVNTTDVFLATPNKGLVSGMFGSFTDAPFGAREELQEIMYSFGVEYWYDNMFAIRGGYFHESQFKGNRKYFTTGFGVRYQKIGLDLCYLIAVQRVNPLSETLRFALTFNFDKPKKQEMDSVVE